MQKIIPHLWFDHEAEEAARFYASLFPDAKLGRIVRYGTEGRDVHGQPDGRVMTVDFELAGYRLVALNGGPHFRFSPAISLFVTLETEAEVDALWRGLVEGGDVMMPLDSYDWSARYGWLSDRYGLSWQITASALPAMMADPDQARVDRVMHAFMQMKKFDIAALEQAREGAALRKASVR